MRTTPEFNVSDAVDRRALPSMDFVDKHMFTELRVVSKSVERYSMTADDFLHLGGKRDKLQRSK